MYACISVSRDVVVQSYSMRRFKPTTVKMDRVCMYVDANLNNSSNDSIRFYSTLLILTFISRLAIYPVSAVLTAVSTSPSLPPIV